MPKTNQMIAVVRTLSPDPVELQIGDEVRVKRGLLPEEMGEWPNLYPVCPDITGWVLVITDILVYNDIPSVVLDYDYMVPRAAVEKVGVEGKLIGPDRPVKNLRIRVDPGAEAVYIAIKGCGFTLDESEFVLTDKWLDLPAVHNLNDLAIRGPVTRRIYVMWEKPSA